MLFLHSLPLRISFFLHKEAACCVATQSPAKDRSSNLRNRAKKSLLILQSSPERGRGEGGREERVWRLEFSRSSSSSTIDRRNDSFVLCIITYAQLRSPSEREMTERNAVWKGRGENYEIVWERREAKGNTKFSMCVPR